MEYLDIILTICENPLCLYGYFILSSLNLAHAFRGRCSELRFGQVKHIELKDEEEEVVEEEEKEELEEEEEE